MNAFENTEKVLCSALGARRSISYLNDFFLPILAPARRWKRDQDGASLQLSPELIRMLSNATISNSFIPSLRKIRSKYQPTVLPRNSPIYTKKKAHSKRPIRLPNWNRLFAWNWHKKEFSTWIFPLVSGKYPSSCINRPSLESINLRQTSSPWHFSWKRKSWSLRATGFLESHKDREHIKSFWTLLVY